MTGGATGFKPVAREAPMARPGSFQFSGKWAEAARQLPETGMGYTIVKITLVDGKCFDQVIVESGHLSRIRGLFDVPFCEIDIAEINATHEKWNFDEPP